MEAEPRPADLVTKALVREWVWREMERLGVARFPTPCRGRIPNFEGSKRIAARLGTLEVYRRAEAVFVGPDVVLKACRDRVLSDGKTLAYATPGMREFKEIRPGMERRDTSIRGLKRYGDALATAVSVIILGSVAVDLKGNRRKEFVIQIPVPDQRRITAQRRVHHRLAGALRRMGGSRVPGSILARPEAGRDRPAETKIPGTEI